MFTGLTVDPEQVGGVQRNEADMPPWMTNDLELEPPRDIFTATQYYASFQEDMVDEEPRQEQDPW